MFQKTERHTNKMRPSKATSNIRRLFASVNVHFNNSLNTEVQNQNEI